MAATPARRIPGPFDFANGRIGVLIVFLVFCLPLFFGLRTFDLETDEGIYSYSVDRILEAGGWLDPKSSPSETRTFLEKPPLKFWIVAAPIKAGLLPWNEFGLRFWDALFGSIAFLYVFVLGRKIAGPLCGFVAVGLLFTHGPLVFDHGLLTNNMEASLILGYCGGLYHFVRWVEDDAGGRRQAYWVAIYFVLGFMTKFVAAIFLPAIIFGVSLLHGATRRTLLARWKEWLAPMALALVLILPWFIYAQVNYGRELWDTMLRYHVYTRFTGSLDPSHLHPWNYYFQNFMARLQDAEVLWLVVAGFVLVIYQLVKAPSLLAWLLAIWMVPLAVISTGSSKIYHYVYPFLPPFMLAAGWFVSTFVSMAVPHVRRWAAIAEERIDERFPRLPRWSRLGAVRWSAITLIWIAAALALGTWVTNTVDIHIGKTTLLRSSGFFRPIVVILLVALVSRRLPKVATLVVLLTVASWMPELVYRQAWERIRTPKHPMLDAQRCLLSVESQLAQSRTPGSALPGLYVDTERGMWHPIYYYFRRVQPWTLEEAPSAARLDRMLHDPLAMRPSLVWEARYNEYLAGPDKARFEQAPAPGVVKLLDYVLLLPGPYAACAPKT